MDEKSKALTAFPVGPVGFYQYELMTFGFTNAPATFQRLMESCLGDMHLKWVIIYLDDIIIMSLASLLAATAGTNIIETAIVFVH